MSKSLRILLLLGSCESMGVSDVSRELGVAVSTAHRLLNIMRVHGFVTQDKQSRRYRLGDAALHLGKQSHGEHDLRALCHPFLVRLRSELNETVDLIVLDGAEALFIDGLPSRRCPSVATRTGLRIPAYATAGGKALLAQMPYAALRAQFPDELHRLTRHTVPDFTTLQHELERVRIRGFALDRGEYQAQVRSISVAINDRRGRPIAAVAVVGPSDRWGIRKLKTLAPRLGGAAAAITHGLGQAAGPTSP
ncbi:IclR family transcriptional regulator [Streptomyces sp. NPDC056161]|uniref:IclR family transcriptional regulator n=1 Tax=Streptomyces sp. NPDC056161 TaxID=3345732 RepID=UPI0035DC912A